MSEKVTKGILSKTRFILEKDWEYRKEVSFVYPDDGDGGYRHSSLELDKEVWVDMGSPETITVTVEPGDLLNDEV